MKIEHLAIWTSDLDRLRSFYERYFGAVAGLKYHNPKKLFESYFLSFKGGARLELMYKPGLPQDTHLDHTGLAHFAISVGSQERVIELTEQLRHDGFSIAGEPRVTGDGYFESVVVDPDGNRIEITV
jgi:lactoylglutathione lyase